MKILEHTKVEYVWGCIRLNSYVHMHTEALLFAKCTVCRQFQCCVQAAYEVTREPLYSDMFNHPNGIMQTASVLHSREHQAEFAGAGVSHGGDQECCFPFRASTTWEPHWPSLWVSHLPWCEFSRS